MTSREKDTMELVLSIMFPSLPLNPGVQSVLLQLSQNPGQMSTRDRSLLIEFFQEALFDRELYRSCWYFLKLLKIPDVTGLSEKELDAILATGLEGLTDERLGALVLSERGLCQLVPLLRDAVKGRTSPYWVRLRDARTKKK